MTEATSDPLHRREGESPTERPKAGLGGRWETDSNPALVEKVIHSWKPVQGRESLNLFLQTLGRSSGCR